MGGSRGGTGVRTPLKNHKNIQVGFPSNIDPDPLKITKLPSSDLYKAAFNGVPLTRQQNAISMAFR